MIALILLATFATPVVAGTDDPGVNRRQHRQKDRIKQGVRTGELTRQEAQKLRAEQKAIREKERALKSDGQLTKDERKDLHQDLNQSSQHIAEEKHDAEKR
jgi:Skp family chaperone for outer membrane proteins